MMNLKRQKITALVLAAGKGTRMGSGHKPKVLHTLAGKTLLEHVLDSLWDLSLEHYCLVLGKDWRNFLPTVEKYRGLSVCVQEVQNGTAGAVASCSELYNSEEPISYAKGALVHGAKRSNEGAVLICYGDTPLIDKAVLETFIQDFQDKGSFLSVLGMDHPNPTGYGRLILDKEGLLEAIVEEKDADSKIREISLCNSGIILARTDFLFDLLRKVKNQNKQNEFYLTDVISLARAEGKAVHVLVTKNWEMLTGVNTQDQLKEAEKIFVSRTSSVLQR